MSTSTAHSVPPEVILEGRGRDLDIPVITLDLEGGAIARSILRGLAKSVTRATERLGTRSLAIIADGDPGESETHAHRVLEAARASRAFQIDLTHDAALALRDELDRALDIAELTCRQNGCIAIGTLDELCPPHYDAADRRIGA